jgi:hypothetical protein
MFKYVLSLTFAACLATAATISTSATCDGVTVVGTFSAMCDDGHASARADVGALFVGVSAGPSALPGVGSASASAHFSDDFVFTVFGGTGEGFYFPCFDGLARTAAGAFISIGGIGGPPRNPCGMSFSSSKPFTFGVPQIVQVDVTGGATYDSHLPIVSDATEFGAGIAFFDPSGHPLFPNATFTLVEVPEPSALSLLSIGLLFFVAVWRISNHQV